MPALTSPSEFLGGQIPTPVLGPAAQKIPVQYESPNDQAVSASFAIELGNIEASGKDPNTAWADAVAEAKRVGQRLGVK